MSSNPSLLVGLGNPGREYAESRHNVGFMVADWLCARGGGSYREKFSGQTARVTVEGSPCVLLKPETYMNESGRSVQPAAAFLKVPPADIVVVHDEVDLPFGDVRIKVGGGHAGHNGLRSIIRHLGTADFVRIRIGVGRPPPGYGGEMADFVLGGFGPVERAELPDVVAKAGRAFERIFAVGLERAMNELNTRPKAKKSGSGVGGAPTGGEPPKNPGETKSFAPRESRGSRDRSACC